MAQSDDDFLGADYDPSYFKSDAVQSPIDRALGLLKDPQTMSGLETLFKESYKFIRLADDLHEIRSYLNDIRLCFIALTVSGYVGILLYALILCLKRRRSTGDGGDGGSRYRGSSGTMRPRAGSRFDNFDLEAAGGMMTGGVGGGHEWEDTNAIGMPPPPPPNGTAIRTPDGYRYKPPNVVRRASGGGGGNSVMGMTSAHPYQQRMSSLEVVDVNKSSADSYNNAFPSTGVMMSSTSSGSPGQRAPSDSGFIEKVK